MQETTDTGAGIVVAKRTCKYLPCQNTIQVLRGHRPRIYCSNACKQADFQRMRAEQERARMEQERLARWGCFTPTTQRVLAQVEQSMGRDATEMLASIIDQEITRSQETASTQLDQELSVLRDKQLTRVDKLKARIAMLEQQLADTHQNQVPQANESQEIIEQLTSELTRYRAIVDLDERATLQRQLIIFGEQLHWRRILTPNIAPGEEQWASFAASADIMALARAIFEAQGYLSNLRALGIIAGPESSPLEARIKTLEAENDVLKQQMETMQHIERLYRTDTRSYAFKTWLQKQALAFATTDFGKRFLASPEIPPRGSRSHYEALMRRDGYTPDDFDIFRDAWRSMLLAQTTMVSHDSTSK